MSGSTTASSAEGRGKSALSRTNPLRPDMPWLLIFIEGILAAAIGIYGLVDNDAAQKDVLLLIGGFVLINGLLNLLDAVRDKQTNGTVRQVRLIRIAASIVLGGLVVLNYFGDFWSKETSRWMIGIGLVATGLLSIVASIMNREQQSLRRGTIIFAVLLIVWGIWMIFQVANDRSSIGTLSWIMLAIGVALMGLGFFRKTQLDKAKAMIATTASTSK